MCFFNNYIGLKSIYVISKLIHRVREFKQLKKKVKSCIKKSDKISVVKVDDSRRSFFIYFSTLKIFSFFFTSFEQIKNVVFSKI